MKNELLELEIDTPQNGPVYFGPLGRRLRGRFDSLRAARHDKDAAVLLNEYPQPIPGQRLVINVDTGECCVVEPLHEEAYAAIRSKIEKAKMELEPARQSVASPHLPTWLHWARRLVQGGSAKVLRGMLPDDNGGDPQVAFSPVGPSKPGPMAQMAKLIERQSAALERQAAAFEKLVSELLKRK